MTELRKCSSILLTQNIREFEKGLRLVAGRLFVVDKAARYGASQTEGVTFIDAPKANKWTFYAEFVKEQHISVVYVQGFRDLIFWGVLKIIKRLPCKILVVSHRPYTWVKLRTAISSLFLAKVFADVMIFISLREFCRFERFCLFLRLKAFYVPNSIDEDRFPSGKGHWATSRQLSLVSVGTVEPRKNQKFLVGLVRELLKRGVDCNVGIIGDYQLGASLNQEYYEVICKQIEEAKIRERFKFMGRVPYDDVPIKLKEYDIFVSTSKSEMYPFSILEAMLTGLPIIAFDTNGICDEIKDGYNGYLIPLHLSEEESIRRWADCIQLLMENDNLSVFGAHSRDVALACNSSRALALRMSNVLSVIM